MTKRAPACDLLAELLVLGDHLALVALVVRDDAAEEEVRLREARVRPALVPQPVVHLGEEAQQADRVDVEDGRGESAVPHHRVVAREREDVVEPGGGELPAAALERVAIPVLAGEMDDHLLPARHQVRPEGVRREHRVAAGVVGDREHVDPRVLRELAGEIEHLRAPVRGDRTAARHELGGDDERAGLSELLAKRRHGFLSATASRIAAPAAATARSALSRRFTSTKNAWIWSSCIVTVTGTPAASSAAA